jgi:hypothetical protein
MYKSYVSFNKNHVNRDGLHVHGDLKMGDRSTFFAHLSKQIKHFVMEQLRLGLTLFHIMAKHRQHVKNIMLRTCELNRNMFLIKQDVKVLFGKLAQKTYYLHKNDAKSVHMWVEQNINSVSYYQEIRIEVDGGFTR